MIFFSWFGFLNHENFYFLVLEKQGYLLFILVLGMLALCGQLFV